ncbi:unnamed protein product [Urochloa humidicola]
MLYVCRVEPKPVVMAAAQLKRLAVLPPNGAHPRLEHLMRSLDSRFLRTNMLSVLAELLRQDHVILIPRFFSLPPQ